MFDDRHGPQDWDESVTEWTTWAEDEEGAPSSENPAPLAL
jgi:hypothetical protein